MCYPVPEILGAHNLVASKKQGRELIRRCVEGIGLIPEGPKKVTIEYKTPEIPSPALSQQMVAGAISARRQPGSGLFVIEHRRKEVGIGSILKRIHRFSEPDLVPG